ncbi:lipoprotein [Listeria cornellensis FSL F6-0969]|uniref:Lipoprotein n=2 Tax=Listeria cornellensis TaxID=1494961 RepID=W7C2X3_9LIST|nr:lipoprotein [Listeria cornellensis FSL F6-0969]
MVAYDKSGKELSRQQVKYPAISVGTITPKEMTIPGDKNITGTYTGDVASITVGVKRGTAEEVISKGGTVKDGTITFYSNDKIKAATDVVTVRAYDTSGKLLDTKVVKLKGVAVVTTGEIALDTFTVGDKNITGTFTGDVKSVKVTVGGAPYSGGTFNADGTFKFYVFGKTILVDDIIEIQALDKTGKVLDTKTTTVLAK